MRNGQKLTWHDTRLSGTSTAGISWQCAQGSTRWSQMCTHIPPSDMSTDACFVSTECTGDCLTFAGRFSICIRAPTHVMHCKIARKQARASCTQSCARRMGARSPIRSSPRSRLSTNVPAAASRALPPFRCSSSQMLFPAYYLQLPVRSLKAADGEGQRQLSVDSLMCLESTCNQCRCEGGPCLHLPAAVAAGMFAPSC